MNYICIAEEGERDLVTKYLPDCQWPIIVTGVGAINVIQALNEDAFESGTFLCGGSTRSISFGAFPLSTCFCN